MFETTFNLPKIRGAYRFNVDLSKTNWFRVGGTAQILFLPKDLDDLAFFLKNRSQSLPITILGVGSNIIIRDGGIEGVVIKLGGNFAKINHIENDAKPPEFTTLKPNISLPNKSDSDDFEYIRIGSGCLCVNAALYCKIDGFAGLEFLSGIPGTIGGAIAMNAGCYDGDIESRLVAASAVDFDGNIIQFQNSDFGFKYRGSSLQKNLIFVEGIFKVEKSTPEKIGKKIAEFNQRRESAQPIRSKTGGSTFKNPLPQNLPDHLKDKKAWQLIDEAGCRGMKIGDAQISEKHCNFMINTGNARAQDLINLGNQVIDAVKGKTGITLEWEIKIIGKD